MTESDTGSAWRIPAAPIAAWVVDDVASNATGPLAGVRIGVKELIAVRGHGCSANSRVTLPAEWSGTELENPVVSQLRSAGASITCMTTSHEFAWGITTREGLRVVENPLISGRIAGGSSGGAAVATATRLVDVGLGTDTAGSIRIPAAWCGLYGWRPTHGVLDVTHVVPLAPRFDCIGVMTRTAQMLSRTLAALGLPLRSAGSRRVRVPACTPLMSDERSMRAITEAAGTLAERGYTVMDLDLPDPVAMYETFVVVQLAEVLEVHRRVLATWPDQREYYGPGVAARLERAERLRSSEIDAATNDFSRYVDLLRQATSDSVLLVPATGCAPPTLASPDIGRVNGLPLPLRDVVMPHTVPASLAGLPAAVIPWMVDSEPFGVQLVGGKGKDSQLLSAVMDLAYVDANSATEPSARPHGGSVQ